MSSRDVVVMSKGYVVCCVEAELPAMAAEPNIESKNTALLLVLLCRLSDELFDVVSRSLNDNSVSSMFIA